LVKNSSFGFLCVGFRVGKKPNVLFVRLAFRLAANGFVYGFVAVYKLQFFRILKFGL